MSKRNAMAVVSSALQDMDLNGLAAFINAEHGAAQQAALTAVSCSVVAREHAVKCGEALLVVKGRLGHGSLGEWIKDELSFSHDTAGRYMNAAKGLIEKKSNSADLRNFAVDRAIGMLSLTPGPEESESLPEAQNVAQEGNVEAESSLFGDGQGEDASGEKEAAGEAKSDPPATPAQSEEDMTPPVVEPLACEQLERVLSKVGQLLLGYESQWPMPRKMSVAGRRSVQVSIGNVITHLKKLLKESGDVKSGKKETARNRRGKGA